MGVVADPNRQSRPDPGGPGPTQGVGADANCFPFFLFSFFFFLLLSAGFHVEGVFIRCGILIPFFQCSVLFFCTHSLAFIILPAPAGHFLSALVSKVVVAFSSFVMLYSLSRFIPSLAPLPSFVWNYPFCPRSMSALLT